MKSRNKMRVYVSIFRTPRASNKYHWAITTGPKNEDPLGEHPLEGRKYHVTNLISQHNPTAEWRYQEETVIAGLATGTTIGRVTIGKVLDEAAFSEVLRKIAVHQGNPNWRCRHWVIDAIQALAGSGTIGTSVDLCDWDAIQRFAEDFGKTNRESGRFTTSSLKSIQLIPTVDMMSGRIMVP